jgi:predicted phosphohydrolase
MKVKKVKQSVTGLEWPRGFQEVRFSDFMTTAQDGGKVIILMHRPPLSSGNTPGTHFC